MDIRAHEDVRKKRKKRSFFGVVLRTLFALSYFLREKIRKDITLMFQNGRLFVGFLFFLVGILSFSSDRYCDGNSSSYYACTRPSTYYYYPWWSVLLIIIGSFLIILWFLRRNK